MQQCSHMQSRGHVSVLKQGEKGGATVVEGAMECFFQCISELEWIAMVWLGMCVGMKCCELGPWLTHKRCHGPAFIPCVASFFSSKFDV